MPKKRTAKKRTPSKPCPACGKSNHPRKKICAHCGADTTVAKNGAKNTRVTKQAAVKRRVKTRKPVIASNGSPSVSEIKEAASYLRRFSSKKDAIAAIEGAAEILNVS